MKKNFTTGFVLGFSILLLMAAKITDDKLLIGNPGSTDDKELVFNTNDGVGNQVLKVVDATKELLFGRGVDQDEIIRFDVGKGAANPYLGYNATEGTVGFSQDGVEFAEFGTGSGGGGADGINILLNPGFEDGVTEGWTASTVVPTQESFATPSPGNEFFAQMTFGGASEFFESVLTDKPDSLGIGCSARFRYNGGDENIDAVVIDGSANELARETLIATSDWSLITPLQFPCASQMKIRFESTAASAQIQIDDVYLGSTLGATSLNTIQKQQISHQSAGSTLVNRSAEYQFNISNLVLSGPELITPADDTPNTRTTFTVNEENVRLSVSSSTFMSPTNSKTCIAINGLIIHRGSSNYTSSVYSSVALVDYPVAQGDVVTFGACQDPLSFDNGRNIVNGSEVAHFEIVASKIIQNEAFEAKTQNFLIDAQIGSASSPLFGSAGTPTELNWATLDMVVFKGAAKIPCSGTNPSTGLTCSAGNETFGIVFDAPSAGRYKVCYNLVTRNPSGVSGIRMSLVENNTINILQTGTTHANADTDYNMNRGCDYFDLSSAGETTFKMFYENSAGSMQLYTNRETNVYERAFTIQVEKVAQNVVAPILVGGQVFEPGANKKRLKKYTLIFGGAGADGVCTASPCTIIKETEDWIDGNITLVGGSGGAFAITTNPVFKPNEDLECYISASGQGTNGILPYLNRTGSSGRAAYKADGTGVLDLSGVNSHFVDARDLANVRVDARINFTCYGEE